MPASVVKSFADKTGKSVAEVEKLWDKAKAAAKEQGREEDFAYTTGILKKMVGIKENLADEILSFFEANVVLSIKPTKHNKAVLKKRGLFSDDSRYFMDMYDKILSDKEFSHRMETKSDQFIADEFMKAGLKF